MEQLIRFQSEAELEHIEGLYAQKVKNKFFKLTWYHWGLLELPDDTIVKKTWLLGRHGQVWYYEVYANFMVSPLKTKLIFEGGMLWLAELLDRGFDEKNNCTDISCEGFEMVRYHNNGKVRHRFCGDVWGDDYLKEIIARVESEVMKAWSCTQICRVKT